MSTDKGAHRTLRTTGAATAITAAVGTLASRDVRSPWYERLAKPSFQPPDAAFPIAWTALYTDIAVSSAVAIDRLRADERHVEAARYERVLGVNLVLNAAWSWVFFRWHKLGPATAVAGALTASCVELSVRAGRASRPAGLALAPYAMWCAFATALTGAIWRRNR